MLGETNLYVRLVVGFSKPFSINQSDVVYMRVFLWSLAIRFAAIIFQGLPKFKGNVFRGIRGPLPASYQKGKKVVWWGFSSTTGQIEVAQNFVGKVVLIIIVFINSTVTFIFFDAFFSFILYPFYCIYSNLSFCIQVGDRAIFVVETENGVDIEPYSAYHKETEILLPAGAILEVMGITEPAEGLKIVQLKECSSSGPKLIK